MEVQAEEQVSTPFVKLPRKRRQVRSAWIILKEYYYKVHITENVIIKGQ
jgi:hypothetical protein